MFFLISLAVAGDSVVTPFGFVRPAFFWMQDNEVVTTDQDGFVVPARLGLKASLPSGFGAMVETEVSPEFSMKDAYASWSSGQHVQLLVGQSKVPASVYHMTSDTRRLLPVGPRIITSTGLTREIGVRFMGGLPIGDKAAARVYGMAANGEGANKVQNVNQKFLYAVRGELMPFGAQETSMEGAGSGALYLGVGGGWIYNFTGEDTTAAERNTYSADLRFAYKWFSVQGEYLTTDVVNASAEVADYHITGFYGQAGMLLPFAPLDQHVELVGRFEQSDPNTEFADAGASGSGLSTQPTYQAAQVITGGLNVYLDAHAKNFHDIKLQLAYIHATETEGAATDDDMAVAMGVIRF